MQSNSGFQNDRQSGNAKWIAPALSFHANKVLLCSPRKASVRDTSMKRWDVQSIVRADCFFLWQSLLTRRPASSKMSRCRILPQMIDEALKKSSHQDLLRLLLSSITPALSPEARRTCTWHLTAVKQHNLTAAMRPWALPTALCRPAWQAHAVQGSPACPVLLEIRAAVFAISGHVCCVWEQWGYCQWCFLALLGAGVEPAQMGHAGGTECPRRWSISQEKRGWHAQLSQIFLLSTAPTVLQLLSKQENAAARNMLLL